MQAVKQASHQMDQYLQIPLRELGPEKLLTNLIIVVLKASCAQSDKETN